ncbi:TonB-dependent receptor [Novosphingobium sp. Rr 2-17]|uniref:TonB-dependent siderophore receptor n=1 Tax=Novosphingobium sp. Rr 2-17 TaxID=555793 RepID=UPI0002697ECB|nr:TonB-dependent receptor [Novosphingobium sp. Rr 2-17]EIZ79006.1 TonB-dependent receptor [Novosphingobium sp. Rr 2-17]
MKFTAFLLAGTTLACLPQIANAQAAQGSPAPATDQAAAEPSPADVTEIIVTGTARAERRLTTSISVSAVDAKDLVKLAPMGSADLLRNIPGLRAESSGGESNANIAVRGLPVASGGGKFVQFQEDGLPVLDFGDIAFATADTFVRPDYNVSRVEVVRGGSASTFTSNAPGAIINFISKTGEVAGGSIGVTKGIDFNRTRVDADYGAPIGEDWRFHIGGFYRIGDGIRDAGYTAEKGGQVKGNVTRTFSNGFIRLNFKFLDDRSPIYVPSPINVTGTASNPSYTSYPGFDVRSGTSLSQYFRSDVAIGHDGKRIVSDLGDGYRVKTRGIGAEASFDLGGGWRVDDKFNIASNSGSFATSYPGQVAPLTTLMNQIGGAGATLRYANGPNAGQVIANPSTLNGNGLGINALTFGVTLDDFTNATNILTVNRDFNVGSGTGNLTFGYFKSYQAIKMDWHWNSYLQEVKGKDAALLDVYNAAGQAVTQNGLIAYGEPVFGNCCQRYYDVSYKIDAPYLAVSYKTGALSLDGSVRFNSSKASGSYAGSTGLSTIDVNQDGIIQAPELSVPVASTQASSPVNYRKNYFTYSVGANYEVMPDLALFARVSRGARFNADRILFGGGVRSDGSVADEVAVNFVNQQEAGVKFRQGGFYANLTAFRATTAESNEIVIPQQMVINNTYRSYGLEAEGGFDRGIFHLVAGATYTHARIVKSQVNPALNGNVPYRQAALVFQVTPSISTDKFEIGANITGTTSSYASDLNTLKIPGYVMTNAFASYALTPTLRLSVSAQNLFNVIGITEVGQVPDSVPANGINTARAFPGRNVSATATLRF